MCPSQLLVNLGVSHETQGNLELAIRCYREATKNKPDYARAHKLLGSCLIETQNYEVAISALEKAIQYSPGFADAYCDLGCALQVVLDSQSCPWLSMYWTDNVCSKPFYLVGSVVSRRHCDNFEKAADVN